MSRPTLMDCTIEMKRRRLALRLAMEAQPWWSAPEPKPAAELKPVTLSVLKAKPEPPVPRKPRSFTHAEWYFQFSDGTVWARCRAEGCGFGLTHKRHSDGSKAGMYYQGDFKDAVPEVTLPDQPDQPDQPAEESEENFDERPPLIAEPVERVAGVEDDNTSEDDPESGQEAEEESAFVVAMQDEDEP